MWEVTIWVARQNHQVISGLTETEVRPTFSEAVKAAEARATCLLRQAAKVLAFDPEFGVMCHMRFRSRLPSTKSPAIPPPHGSPPPTTN